jgi:hypothetical protein
MERFIALPKGPPKVLISSISFRLIFKVRDMPVESEVLHMALFTKIQYSLQDAAR